MGGAGSFWNLYSFPRDGYVVRIVEIFGMDDQQMGLAEEEEQMAIHSGSEEE